MNDAERGIAVLDRLRDESKRNEVVDALEVNLLPHQLQMDAVEALDPSVERVDRNLRLVETRAQCLRQLVDDAFGVLPSRFNFRAKPFVRLRLEVLERQLFELVLDLAHAEAVGDRGVDVEGFLGDLDSALFREVVQRPHVMETVGELDEDDANVIHHRQQHLAEVLGLPLFAR